MGGGECRAPGESHVVTGLFLSAARRSQDRFHERGRNDHLCSEELRSGATQTLQSPKSRSVSISSRFVIHPINIDTASASGSNAATLSDAAQLASALLLRTNAQANCHDPPPIHKDLARQGTEPTLENTAWVACHGGIADGTPSQIVQRRSQLSHAAATGVEKRVGTIGAARATPERAELRRKVAIVVGGPRCRRHGFVRRRRSLTPTVSGLMTVRIPRQRRPSSKGQRERISRDGMLRSTSHSRAPTAGVDIHHRIDLDSAAAICPPR